MGSSFSKFRSYLLNCDEYAALELYSNSLELQHGLDPNSSYGEALNNNTPVHLAAQHAMKALLRIFLNELKGNPNKKNAIGQTALHLVCQGNFTKIEANQERRSYCLNLLLQWKSPEDGETKVQLDCVDDEGNTALHYAAASGLKRCVEILFLHGAPLFLENKSSETACDLAEKNKHKDIALYLETKMLFYSNHFNENIDSSTEEDPREEVLSGLRAQDLQEAKDQLLVETSDMLHVPLFTAEVLLRNYEWSRQSLCDSWMKDPITCCTEAGITPPSSAINFSPTHDSLKTCCTMIQNEYQNESLNSPLRALPVKDEIVCDICTLNIVAEDIIQVPCTHQFCKECWKVYLTAKIRNGEAHNILCPAFDCSFVVPIHVIEGLVPADVLKRYLQFDIKAFVESNPSIKWCPDHTCARAVKVPEMEKRNNEVSTISFTSSFFTTPLPISHSVDCGNGHFFCWECLGEAHAPCGCEKWKEWQTKIAEIKPQELKNTYSEAEEAENFLWLATNSKPCPNCSRRIQRNEGCNHMKCTKCKFEFCWVCLDSWKKHNQDTGGYFRCDRNTAVRKTKEKTEASIAQAEENNKCKQELKRFFQYYSHFKEHEDSYKLEEPFIKHMQDKMDILSSNMASASCEIIDFSFLEDSIYELLRNRRILCGSYVYGFYLEDNGYNKTFFEYLQNKLEESTKKMAEVIARTYLQTPKSKIIQMTSSLKRKRLDLLNAVQKGLFPPETPPGARKRGKHKLSGFVGLDSSDDDPLLSQAILDSLETLDPNDPWVINQYGKHTNVAAVCDWPDYDSDEDIPCNPVLTSVLGECSRDGCSRSRAKNQRTGEIHEYCSLSCKHWEVLKPDSPKVTATIHPVIEKLIALELSKLLMPQNQQTSSDVPESDAVCPVTETNIGPLNNISNTTNEEEPLEPETPRSASSLNEQNDSEEINTLSDGTGEEIPLTLLKESSNNISSQGTTLKETTINFYLKSSNDIHNNINIQIGNGCSKTEKELFKDNQADIHKSNESVNISIS